MFGLKLPVAVVRYLIFLVIVSCFVCAAQAACNVNTGCTTKCDLKLNWRNSAHPGNEICRFRQEMDDEGPNYLPKYGFDKAYLCTDSSKAPLNADKNSVKLRNYFVTAGLWACHPSPFGYWLPANMRKGALLQAGDSLYVYRKCAS